MSFYRIFSFFSVLALTLVSSAFAAPKVGDSATLSGTVVGNGVNAPVITNQKITGYNVNTDVYTIVRSQTVAGQSQSTEIQVAAGDLLSEETAVMIVMACESQGIGTKEYIKVASGEFDSCRVVGDNGSMIWVASVPFGIVKIETQISIGKVSVGMSSFSRGQ